MMALGGYDWASAFGVHNTALTTFQSVTLYSLTLILHELYYSKYNGTAVEELEALRAKVRAGCKPL